jgi:hypothetical protein
MGYAGHVALPRYMKQALGVNEHLGQYFMKPSDFYDAPIGKVLHFIRSVGLIKG